MNTIAPPSVATGEVTPQVLTFIKDSCNDDPRLEQSTREEIIKTLRKRQFSERKILSLLKQTNWTQVYNHVFS